jgi:hypothetical protein
VREVPLDDWLSVLPEELPDDVQFMKGASSRMGVVREAIFKERGDGEGRLAAACPQKDEHLIQLVHFAPDEGREELGIEACVLVPQTVVGSGGRIVSEELLGETRLLQSLVHVTRKGSVGRESKVGVSGAQRRVIWRLRQGMKAM